MQFDGQLSETPLPGDTSDGKHEIGCTDIITLTFYPNGFADDISPEELLAKVEARYQSMETYQATGVVSMDMETDRGNLTTELSFSILLMKPNLYRISWDSNGNGFSNSGVVWNDGTKPYLYLPGNKAYSEMDSDEIALASATGISSGVAFNIPSLFLPVFREQGPSLSRLKGLKIEGSETIEGEDCFVLTASSPMSNREIFWVSKSDFTIRKLSRSLEPPENDGTPGLSEEQIDEALIVMRKEVTEENRQQMKEMLSSMKSARERVKGVSTEVHHNVSSPEIRRSEFDFILPADAVLKDSWQSMYEPASHPETEPVSPTSENFPSLEQVLAAAETYYGNDKEQAEARRLIKLWRNNALSHLWTLANTPGMVSSQWSIVSIIMDVDSPESIDMILEIADGNTRIEAHHAASYLHQISYSHFKNPYLRAHPKLKRIVFELTEDPNTRDSAARIIAAMDWQDGIPLIQPMLQDNNIALRQTAAEALEKLTGVRPVIAQAAERFPNVSLRPDLVGKSSQLKRKLHESPDFIKFTPWFDGNLSFVQSMKQNFGRTQAIKVYDANMNPSETYRVSPFIHDFIMAPLGETGTQMVALVSEEGYRAEYIAAFDKSGEALWTRRYETSGIESFTPVYDDHGTISSLVIGQGGEQGIRGLSLQGNDLWQLKTQRVLYEVKSHPNAANQFVVSGGSIKLVKIGEKRSQVKTYEGPYLYSSKIEVFVDGAGELQVIAIGSGQNSTPMIVHLNQHLALQWQATVPDRLNNLTMLNLQNAEHGPLFVAASDKGTVYIFDTEGTLLYRDTLVESGETFYSIEGAIVNDNIGYIIPRLAEGFRRYRVQWDSSAR